MCNYVYKNEANHKNLNCQFGDFIKDLPLDYDQKCIFHSSDIQWKKDNDFVGYLKKYRQICQKKKSKINLCQVNFVSDKRSYNIDYLELLVHCELQEACFLETICIEGLKTRKKEISHQILFHDCFFMQNVIFKHCVFKQEVVFSNNLFLNTNKVQSVQISFCQFEGYFEFNHQKDFQANLYIGDCIFKEQVDFISIEKNENCFDIIGNVFHSLFFLRDSSFNNLLVSFSDNHYKENAEFSNVAFKGMTQLNNLKVDENLTFIGNAKCKIFYGQTLFEVIPKQIKGIINFQQTQLTVIDKSELDYLIHLEKIGYRNKKKVSIGPGCIKYRWQTPVKTLNTGLKNGFIIEELTRSFTIFLSNSIQKMVGVEILERTSDEVSFFYFSDEQFSDEQFSEVFINGQQRFFGMMCDSKNPQDHSVSIHNQLNEFQTKLTQNATITKILSEFQQKNWNISDSEALLDAFTLPNQTVISVEGFHQQLTMMNIDKLVEISKATNVPMYLFPITQNFAKNLVKADHIHGKIEIT